MQVIEKCPHCGGDLPELFRLPPSYTTFTPIDRGTPHKCPRCDGKGGWHNHRPTSAGPFEWIACTTCIGSGVLWSRG